MALKPISVQDLGRVRTVATVIARYGFGHVLGPVEGVDVSAIDQAPPAPPGSRLRAMLVDLGPTAVKLGQVLSLRPDILPTPVLAELARLQDDVDPMPMSDVLAVLAEELGRPAEQVFASIEPTPLGSASIAQVHAARLHDGREVAIKVQRRGIEPVIRSDLHILTTLAGLVEGRVQLPGLHTPTAIVREFDAAIQAELDFRRELKAMQRLAKLLADRAVRVPEVYSELCSRRLLVMERIHGQPLSRALPGLDLATRRRVAHDLMDATYAQVFEHGVFHGDPHPGNLFITDEGRLVLLDLGVVGLLTGTMQDLVLQIFTAMVFRDADTLAMSLYRAGATRERIDLTAFRNALERKMVEYRGASLDDLASRDTLVEVVEMATTFKITLPPEFALLARALALIEANVRRLLPDVDIVDEVRPYAERLVAHRFASDRLAREGVGLALRLQAQLRDLPTQVGQTLLDLDAGRLTLVTRDPDAAAMRDTIRTAGLRLSLATVAGAGSVATVLWLPPGAALRDAVGATAAGMTLLATVWLLPHLIAPSTLDLTAWRRTAWRAWSFFRGDR